MPLIHAENIAFGYAHTPVLHNIAFSLEKGETVALVGDNGAGKTSLLRCLAGLERPWAGTIHIDGISMQDNPIEARQRLGYVRDLFGLYDEMTGHEFLRYIAATRKVSAAAYSNQEAWLADGLALTPILDKNIGTMTRGMRQKIALAQAFVHNPTVLLLDEPASGLDPDARQLLSRFINAARALGKTTIVSSHILGELQQYTSVMLVLKNGVLTHVAHTALHGAPPEEGRVYTLNLRSLLVGALRDHLKTAYGLEPQHAADADLSYTVRSDEASVAALLARLAGLPLGLISFDARLQGLAEMYAAANNSAPAQAIPLLRLVAESRVSL